MFNECKMTNDKIRKYYIYRQMLQFNANNIHRGALQHVAIICRTKSTSVFK